jgi:hypothetical protein
MTENRCATLSQELVVFVYSAQEIERIPKRKNCPRLTFDFGLVNLKRLQRAPKISKSTVVKFEFERLPNRKMPPR